MFTDDDLKRLKDALNQNSDSGGYLDGITGKALLARLEAAERVCDSVERFDFDEDRLLKLKAWRKSKGESGRE